MIPTRSNMVRYLVRRYKIRFNESWNIPGTEFHEDTVCNLFPGFISTSRSPLLVHRSVDEGDTDRGSRQQKTYSGRHEGTIVKSMSRQMRTI